MKPRLHPNSTPNLRPLGGSTKFEFHSTDREATSEFQLARGFMRVQVYAQIALGGCYH